MSPPRRSRLGPSSLLLLTLALAACTPRLEGSAPGPVFADADSARLLRVAETAERAGDEDGAIAMRRRVVESDRSNAAARVALGRQMLRRGEGAEASRLFSEAQAISPGLIEARVGAAQAALLLRDDAAAVLLLTGVLASQPSNAAALIAMGVALDRRGDHEGAQRQYRAALAAEPSSTAARNNLGLSLALSGRAGEAVAVLSPLRLASDGRAARYRQNLALVLVLAGRPEEADRLLAADLGPDAARAELAAMDELRMAALPPAP